MKIKASFAETNNSIGAKLTSANETLSADFGEVQVVPGADCFSPTVDIEPIDGGHRISITDKDGTQTADVLDGRDGRDGDPGADGISPTVAVQDITGGHRVTITDKDGAKTFDVMDGKDGTGGGSGGASVQSDWSVNDENDPAYVKNRTHWVEQPYEPIVWDGSIEGRDSVDISLMMGYPAGSVIIYKISDHVLTPDEIAVSKLYASTQSGVNGTATMHTDAEVVPGAIWMYRGVALDGEGYDLLSVTCVSTAIAGDFMSSMGTYIPSTGTYCMPFYTTASIRIDADTYHTIDKKYIPAPEIMWDDVKKRPQISHSEKGSVSVGHSANAEGEFDTAVSNGTTNGRYAFAANSGSASGENSSAFGEGTSAVNDNGFVCGRYNELSTPDRSYVVIVGNGTTSGISNVVRSNAHTLDWNGNAWYAGTVECAGVILTSPSGTRYRLTVADNGTLTTAAV